MKKRVLALVLIFVMAFTGLSGVAFAAEEYDQRPVFDIDEDGVLIGYNGNSANISIPSNVKKIDNFVFTQMDFIKTVTVGSSVTEIGYCAFKDCTALTSVSLPKSLTYLGDSAFLGCTSLKSVTIPSSVTSMGIGVFERCTSLTSATLPSGLTELPEATFSRCTALTSYTVPSNFTSIGFMAFSNCTNLKKVVIPTSVTYLDYSAFEECTGLTEVTLPQNFYDDNFMYFQNYSKITFTVAETGQTTKPEQPTDPVVVPDEPVETPEPEEDVEYFVKTKTYNKNFTDVKEDHWFYNYVVNAFEYGFVNGKTAKSFSYDDTMSVAEAITLAVRMHCTYYSKQLPANSTSAKWYDTYVSYAMASNIIEYGQFDNYEVPVTRAQMASIFVNALPATQYQAIKDTVKIPDVSSSAKYYNAVATLYKAGIVAGSDTRGNFYPQSNIKRSEVAAIVSRIANTQLRIGK